VDRAVVEGPTLELETFTLPGTDLVVDVWKTWRS